MKKTFVSILIIKIGIKFNNHKFILTMQKRKKEPI